MIMKVSVFGGTGGTGKYLVTQLVTAGHSVTVLARTPSKVDAQNGSIKVVEGDARDESKVREVVKGCEVVLAAFGPRSFKKDDIQAVFLSNLVNVMHTENIQRLIELSAWGAGGNVPNGQLFFKLIQKTILKNVFDDKNRGEALVTQSDLSYTLVRPGRLTNKPGQGNVKASLTGEGLSRSISREDVAAFMVSQISDDKWLRSCPIIGY